MSLDQCSTPKVFWTLLMFKTDSDQTLTFFFKFNFIYVHWYEGVRSLGTGVYTWLCAARTWQIFFKNSIYRTILACIPCWLVFVNLKQIQAIWEEGLSTEKIKWLPQIGLWAIRPAQPTVGTAPGHMVLQEADWARPGEPVSSIFHGSRLTPFKDGLWLDVQVTESPSRTKMVLSSVLLQQEKANGNTFYAYVVNRGRHVISMLYIEINNLRWRCS